jgi:electron-transferring-flavoprotein dehydrogenase
MRLKGIHLALKSGMLAAEAAAGALTQEGAAKRGLQRYEDLVADSWIEDELWSVRNFHQGFQNGFWRGILHAGLQTVTGGRGLWRRYSNAPGHTRMATTREYFGSSTIEPPPTSFDERLTFDKLSAVHHSGTAHEEDQPVHLLVNPPDVCYPRCTEEYGNPCRFFCPASVYEMQPSVDGGLRLNISASNCVHCKTCDILDPYQAIDWVPPEGGGGPGYEAM